jgi:hypothetical protein
MVEPEIILDPGAAENGLAGMLADLIRQNLEQRPSKRPDFDALSGTVALDASDIDVQVTLDFQKGRVRIYDGVQGRPMLRIRTDHDTILGLTLLPLRFGLPDFLGPQGRATLKKIVDGSLKIQGLWRAPVVLVRLTRLLSVS